jgi:hypothetical protein
MIWTRIINCSSLISLVEHSQDHIQEIVPSTMSSCLFHKDRKKTRCVKHRQGGPECGVRTDVG